MIETSHPPVVQSGHFRAADERRFRWGRFFGWITLFIILALFPGVLFDQLLGELQTRWGEETRQRQSQKASELLNRIEREFQVAPIIERILKGVLKQVNTVELNASEAARLERALRSKLPSSSNFYWFDQKCRLVAAPGSKSGGMRVWQSLARVLLHAPDRTEADQVFALNLMRTMMGDLLPSRYLESGFNKVIDILCDNQLFFFSLMPLEYQTPLSSKRIGSVMALIPQRVLARDWELKRAMRNLSSPTRWVGGYRISQGKAFGIGGMNENLLVGILQNLRQGISETRVGDEFFLATFRQEDPDLMLVAGVPAESLLHERMPVGLQAGRICLWLFLSLMGWKFLGFGFGRPTPRLSLTGKFLSGTGLLVGLPLTVIILQGFSQMNLMHEVEEIVQHQQADALLMNLEQGVSSRISRTRTRLRKLMQNPDMIRGIDQPTLMALLEDILPVGVAQFMYLHTSGIQISNSLNEGDADNGARVEFICNVLKNAKFPLPPALASRTKTLVGTALGELDVHEDLWENILGKMEIQQLGSLDWYMFFSFSTDSLGGRVAFLSLSLPFAALRDIFLKETRLGLDLPSSDIRIYLEGEASDIPLVRQFLEQTGQEDRSLKATLIHRGVSYLVVGRSLRGLHLNALVLSRIKTSASPTLTRQQIGGFLVLAMLAAALSAMGLRSVFLQPVVVLAEAVKQIDSGTGHSALAPRASDELGTLMVRFNHMMKELQEKARMAGFVRTDLLADANRESSGGARRQRLAVSFAGLRGFSALEARLSPEKAMETMSRFLEGCDRSVREAGGQIDKFMGDAAMAVFLPEDSTRRTPEEKAVHASLNLVKIMDAWNRERLAEGVPPLAFGIGLNVGEAITGNIGSRKKRLDFTAIGDTVNLAARLEKLAGREETPRILASGEICRVAAPGFRWVPSAVTSVRGRSGQVEVKGLQRAESTSHGEKPC